MKLSRKTLILKKYSWELELIEMMLEKVGYLIVLKELKLLFINKIWIMNIFLLKETINLFN
jgi:hypothetical protein